MAEISAKALSKRSRSILKKKPASNIEKSITTTSSQLSTFEKIPLEIRHLIYKYFLPPRNRRINLSAEPEKSPLGPLLRTSRQLNEEIEEWLDLPLQHRYRKSDQWGLVDSRRTKFTLVIDDKFRQMSARELDSRRAAFGNMVATSFNMCDRIVRTVIKAERKRSPVRFKYRCSFEYNRIHRGENDRCKWYWLDPHHGKHIRHLEVTFATHDDAQVWRDSGYGSIRQQTEAWMSANGLLDNSIAAVYLLTPSVLSRLESVDIYLGTADLWGPIIQSVWSLDIMNQPYWAEGRAVIPLTSEFEGGYFWLYPLVELEERRLAPTRPSYTLWDATRVNAPDPFLIHHWPAGINA